MAVAHGGGHVKAVVGAFGGGAVGGAHIFLLAHAHGRARRQHGGQHRQQQEHRAGNSGGGAAILCRQRGRRHRIVARQADQGHQLIAGRVAPRHDARDAVAKCVLALRRQHADALDRQPDAVVGRQQCLHFRRPRRRVAALFDVERAVGRRHRDDAVFAQGADADEGGEIARIDGHQHHAREIFAGAVEAAAEQDEVFAHTQLSRRGAAPMRIADELLFLCSW